MRAFCREQKLGEHSFYWWRGKFRSSAEEPIRFALVETARTSAETPPPLQTELALVLNSGERLQIPVDAAILRLVLSVLREQGPADR